MKKGFTLIELLVVVAIIGVLASIVLSSLGDARNKAKDTRRFSEVRSLQKALELYHLDNGQYPQGYDSGGSALAHNCYSNTLWTNFTTEMQAYISPSIDGPWPYCMYYVTGSFSPCDAVANPEYTIFFSTQSSTFDLDLYSVQGEGGSKHVIVYIRLNWV